MTPTLTAEQLELRDSFRAFLSEHAPVTLLRRKLESAPGSDAALWNKLMELGVLSYFSEPAGEGGGSFRDLGLLAAEAGYGLLPENLIEAALASNLVAVRASKADRAAVTGKFGGPFYSSLAGGTVRVALAAPSSGLTIFEPPKGKGEKISGSARFVAAGDCAEFLLVPEVRSGAVFLCDLRANAGQPNTGQTSTLRAQAETLDRSQTRATLTLKDAPCVKISGIDAGLVERMFRSLCAAELGGAAQKALDLTVEYVRTREQFDVPVGGFQAVQHAAADMLVKADALAALSDFACWSFDASPDQSEIAALSAGLFGCDEAPKVVEKAIQLHGGIGFTWEHDLHLYLRRVRTVTALIAPQAETYSDLLAAAAQS